MNTTLPSESSLISYYESPFWGILVSGCLFGIVLSQGWNYAISNSDGWKLRTLVAILIIFDFISLAIQSDWVHYYLIKFYGVPTALETMIRSGPVSLIFSYTTVYMVEIFFATRVYLVTKRFSITILIIVAATFGYGCGIITVIDAFIHPSVATLGDVLSKTAAGIYSGLSFLSAGIVSIVLSIQFREAWTSIKIKSTSIVLQSLFRFVITRGIIICVLQLTKLILYVMYSNRLYWVGFVIGASRLYIITMLAILNHRKELRSKLGEVVTDSQFIHLGSESGSEPSSVRSSFESPRYGSKAMPSRIGINISTSVMEKAI